MAEFQLLSADIALGGDMMNVVHRDEFEPITYPEMIVLQYLHGEAAVQNVVAVGRIERDEREEFVRLVETYGEDVKTKIFPGAGASIPTEGKRIPKHESKDKGKHRGHDRHEQRQVPDNRSHDQRTGDGTGSGGVAEGSEGPDGGEDKAQHQTQKPELEPEQDPFRGEAEPLSIATDNLGEPMTTNVNGDEKPAPKIAKRMPSVQLKPKAE